MRLSFVLMVLGSLLAAATARGEQQFPYKAKITTNETFVRSGPGQTYYPTDKLKAGQEVEVYRHDPGGWYAIRPPEGSFAWISGRYLEMKENKLAVVTDEAVAARVGSRFSEIRDVIQVRLHRGEMVEILDAKKPATGSGSTWYKVSPPSGEFRWVFGKYVDPNYSNSGTRATHAAEEAAAASAASAAPATAGTTASAQQPQPETVAPSGFGTVTQRRLSPEEFQAELNALDVELSIMVAEEPTVWQFDPLTLRAQSLLAQAETAIERGRARVLVSKIARFEDIRQRSDAVKAMAADIERTNRQLSAGSAGRRSYAADPRYDGAGKLTPVVSPKAGAPRYALVDGKGEVQCYVSPAPGVDLGHYVGREVGVNGTRGYMPEQRAQHVMAKHITPLDGTTLR